MMTHRTAQRPAAFRHGVRPWLYCLAALLCLHAAPALAASPAQAKRPATTQVVASASPTPAVVTAAADLTKTPPRHTELDFNLYKLGTGNGPTVLVVGGIQGDEPGGFSAASLLVTHYAITNGSVWVVPNLNFPSMIKRSRGPNGDMNRKFAALRKDDPEYDTVCRIKDIILDKQVDIILNLHDGSGFYRPKNEGPMRNPMRWGQSVIIDQAALPGARHGDLAAMAQKAVREVNGGLLSPAHEYHLKNTRTAEGDHEMEKTLTFFAIRHGKPAFGIEASKDFSTEQRAYYHLRVLESFLRQMGVGFRRDFAMTPRGVLAALESDVAVAFFDQRLYLPLDDVRASLGYIPLKKGEKVSFTATKPILAVVDEDDGYRVFYGNRALTRITPEWREYTDGPGSLSLDVDGRKLVVPFGRMVTVRDTFTVHPVDGFRVNAIGAQVARPDARDDSECDVAIRKKDFQNRFSIDKSGTIYRVEVYRGEKFAGMILVRFEGGAKPGKRDMRPSVAGRESLLGY